MGNFFKDAEQGIRNSVYETEGAVFNPDPLLAGIGSAAETDDDRKENIGDVLDPKNIIRDEPKSQEEEDAERKLQEQQQQLQDVGNSELDIYRDIINRDTSITDGQQATLDRFQREEEMRARALAASLGISGSTLESSILSRTSENKMIAEDNMVRQNRREVFTEAEVHFQNAVTALGMSNAQLQSLYQGHVQRRQESQEAFTNLLTTVATMVASYYTGGAAGAVVAGASQAGQRQEGPVYGPSYDSSQPVDYLQTNYFE